MANRTTIETTENDEFWGEGFTDWDNVKRAKPLFEGHRQPILPSEEVGFYDLKDPEVLRKQAKMAKDHGIDGFVFHYYWFDGKKVLDTPLNNWLADPSIDMPLALCWANEPWTRRWDGLESDVLIPQTYGEDWADRFWDDIAPALLDPRYIRLDGAPVLAVYRIGEIPDPLSAIDAWRRRAADDGHPALHVLAVVPSREVADLRLQIVQAIDGLIGFPPGSGIEIDSLAELISERVPLSGDFMSFHSAAGAVPPLSMRGHRFFPGLMPGWDNTARRAEGAFGFVGANPVTFRGAIASCGTGYSSISGAVFVNAWNEWAEGAALEPSMRFGEGLTSSIKDGWPSV